MEQKTEIKGKISTDTVPIPPTEQQKNFYRDFFNSFSPVLKRIAANSDDIQASLELLHQQVESSQGFIKISSKTTLPLLDALISFSKETLEKLKADEKLTYKKVRNEFNFMYVPDEVIKITFEHLKGRTPSTERVLEVFYAWISDSISDALCTNEQISKVVAARGAHAPMGLYKRLFSTCFSAARMIHKIESLLPKSEKAQEENIPTMRDLCSFIEIFYKHADSSLKDGIRTVIQNIVSIHEIKHQESLETPQELFDKALYFNSSPFLRMPFLKQYVSSDDPWSDLKNASIPNDGAIERIPLAIAKRNKKHPPSKESRIIIVDTIAKGKEIFSLLASTLDIDIGFIHGKLSKEEKEFVFDKYQHSENAILVIVEGNDLPPTICKDKVWAICLVHHAEKISEYPIIKPLYVAGRNIHAKLIRTSKSSGEYNRAKAAIKKGKKFSFWIDRDEEVYELTNERKREISIGKSSPTINFINSFNALIILETAKYRSGVIPDKNHVHTQLGLIQNLSKQASEELIPGKGKYKFEKFISLSIEELLDRTASIFEVHVPHGMSSEKAGKIFATTFEYILAFTDFSRSDAPYNKAVAKGILQWVDNVKSKALPETNEDNFLAAALSDPKLVAYLEKKLKMIQSAI